MNIFLKDDEVEEISPIEKSDDKAIVIKDETGKRGGGVTDIQKELAAIDAINLGPTASAAIHGVPVSSASKYSDGKDIKDDDTKIRVLATKHEIADLATAKLMQTLHLIEPKELVSTKNKVMVLNSLSKLVDTVSDKNNGNGGGGGVHLHLYAPNQKKESDYEIIEA